MVPRSGSIATQPVSVMSSSGASRTPYFWISFLISCTFPGATAELSPVTVPGKSLPVSLTGADFALPPGSGLPSISFAPVSGLAAAGVTFLLRKKLQMRTQISGGGQCSNGRPFTVVFCPAVAFPAGIRFVPGLSLSPGQRLFHGVTFSARDEADTTKQVRILIERSECIRRPATRRMQIICALESIPCERLTDSFCSL